MSKTNKQKLTVTFDDCEAGWIRMRLVIGEQSLEVSCSHWLDPLPDLLAWLEAISVGVELCQFTVDEEGSSVAFSACKTDSRTEPDRAYSTLTLTPSYEVPPLRFTLPTFELVGNIYHAFRAFAESDKYVPTQWEHHTLERAVHEKLGMTTAEWIDSVIAREPREVQKALWRLDQSILVNPSNDRENIGTETELLELTGKTSAEAGGLPMYLFVEEEVWGKSLEGNEQSRRQYLEECLTEKGNPTWDGCPWRKMRSPLIEKWLEAEVKPTYSYWKKWLSEKNNTMSENELVG